MSSLRVKIAVQKLSEIIRNSKGKKSISMGTILREAGYSKQTSLKPKLVTESKGFKYEMNKIMPDIKLVEVLAESLKACKLKTMSFDNTLSDSEIKEIIEIKADYKVRDIVRRGKYAYCRYWSPDFLARLKALDFACKIKNYYPSKHQSENKAATPIHLINYADSRTK